MRVLRPVKKAVALLALALATIIAIVAVTRRVCIIVLQRAAVVALIIALVHARAGVAHLVLEIAPVVVLALQKETARLAKANVQHHVKEDVKALAHRAVPVAALRAVREPAPLDVLETAIPGARVLAIKDVIRHVREAVNRLVRAVAKVPALDSAEVVAVGGVQTIVLAHVWEVALAAAGE